MAKKIKHTTGTAAAPFPNRHQLIAWADRIYNAEQPALRPRVGVVRGGKVEAIDVQPIVGENGMEAMFQTDSGMSWKASAGTPFDFDPTALVASSTETGRVWAAAFDGIWASVDGGASFAKLTDWSQLSAWADAPYGSFVMATTAAYAVGDAAPLLIFGTQEAGVVGVHIDDGSIIDLGASLARRAGAIDEVEVAPSGAIRIATAATCGGLGGVFESGDQGATWDPLVVGSAYATLTHAVGHSAAHEVGVIFFRDVTPSRQQEIFRQHRVVPEYPSLEGPLLWFLRTAADDPRSPTDLLQEFEAIDEIDCVLNDLTISED